jgi:glutamate racemase
LNKKVPIGVFDSGFGGLTVLKEITKLLPQYDYVYLGDNARAPYGSRSFETVYEYTLQCVKVLFDKGCPLVILACNTASAKALRNIQQKDLPKLAPDKRVLGVIRPTAEIIGKKSKSGHVGVLGTAGTVNSGSYKMEIAKFYPSAIVTQEACPMWVPLVENNEIEGAGADFFIKKHLDNLLQKDPSIDAIILGCTHYPLLIDKIKKHLSPDIAILSQGEIVANSLADYLQRHQEITKQLTVGGTVEFFTTDYPENFDKPASNFFGKEIRSSHLPV